MAVISEWDQLYSLQRFPEGILQEFHNHGGVLHKVYVLGDAVRPDFAAVQPGLV